MNSINQQQPEHNRDDLTGDAALGKLRELVKQAETCFLCTAITAGRSLSTRPMSVREVDDQGRLWFLSASDSRQNRDIARDAGVQLLFQGSPHSDFLSVYGRAAISTDRARIEQLWQPILKTWFTEGLDDPRITILTVTPSEAYYWDTKHNRAVMLAKMLIGAIAGKTLDDSIEGTLKV
ncbi:MAG TPA: pyridoxamine 5'-phosphate oxidase family protein [Kofleriaceae bacterium]|nr:pyridoxamine 5'-phosphate oxidase family protein [Kofleriaceae bacterium]